MKVLDLVCAQEHRFEGWFGSEGDFQEQLARGLVQCPLCASADVHKALSAPRLNLRAVAGRDHHTIVDEGEAAPKPRRQREAPAPETPSAAAVPAELQAAWLQLARRIVAQTEDVGNRFAEEARRMHYGEAEERGIRGQATPQQASELLEEGITVLPILLPEAAKEPLQ
ncbi:DUF1178 domain-containing protein [Melaminivora suipulveris]|uniref:DUF1178 domain-containing protein n=1 Tax=Melaminivora suipulveris TaxID=2109913 RepID=A0A2R3QEN3_9BURK|nr:DUF1178 family protein [Melaminivora suipulveris]AVO50134.1 DUF1178 domain-containing protein [Melaminivora suipulveris]